MTVSEKTAYLNGLLEGLSISKDTNEGKMFHAIVDALNTISSDVTSLNEISEQLSEEVDDIYEELECIEEDLDVLFDEDGGHVCSCGECGGHDDDLDDMYELVCPSCGKSVVLDSSILEQDKIKCPECGEELELDFSDVQDDETSGSN